MDIITDLITWFEAHPRILIGLSVFSIVSFLGTLAALPWMITRIPADYFALPRRRRSRFAERHPVLRWDILILRNLFGFVVFFAGVLMLFLPGQGLITMLAGLILMNYPGKYCIERWIISRPLLLKAVNALRDRRGVAPLHVRYHPRQCRWRPRKRKPK